jgi:virginiamycin A acetyltransferase
MTQQPHSTVEPNLIQRSLKFIKDHVNPPPAPPTLMSENPKYADYSIGKFTYGQPTIKKWNKDGESTLKIGKYCSIGEGVTILLGGEHKSNWVTTYPFDAFVSDFKDLPLNSSKGGVTIGNDVWIGMNALILSGVCIGDGAVIGADAVVAKDIAPYSVVVGNPAKVIRKRFDDGTIEKLLKIKWWDWDFQKVKASIPLMMSDRIGEFVNQCNVER